MVRTNCDYVFLQPIYNATQRQVLWDLEAGFMDKNDFSQLMDDIIIRENLPGNTAQEPKKKVQILVCADFEDSSVPTEKFYSFSPVPMTMLPPFRLCAEVYWKDDDSGKPAPWGGGTGENTLAEIRGVKDKLTTKMKL